MTSANMRLERIRQDFNPQRVDPGNVFNRPMREGNIARDAALIHVTVENVKAFLPIRRSIHPDSARRLRFPLFAPAAKPYSAPRWIRTRDRSLDLNLEPGINLLATGVRGKRPLGLSRRPGRVSVPLPDRGGGIYVTQRTRSPGYAVDALWRGVSTRQCGIDR